MDKQQKELILTYFRKRNQIAFDNNDNKLKPYEIWYGLSNNILSTDDLNEAAIYDLITLWPQMIDKINIDELSISARAYIISRNPKLLDKFNLDKLDPYYRSMLVITILHHSPHLLYLFKDMLFDKNFISNLDSRTVRLLISNNLGFHEYMSDEAISKLNDNDALNLIKNLNPFRIESPELVYRLKDYINSDLYFTVKRYNPAMGEYLLDNYPEKLK